jgi:stage V sporulation protein G
MDISDVRVKLVRDPGERLKAVCTVTFDDVFVVRDVKVVDGANGLFVAMPSQKLSVHCPKCRQKNHLRARFCNECGAKLPPSSAQPDSNGRSRLHRDIAHPIKAAFRQAMQERVIDAFNEELTRAESPDYRPDDLELEPPDDDVEDRETPEGEDREPLEEDDRDALEVEAHDDMDDGDDRGRHDRGGSDYDDIIAELRGRSGGYAEPKRHEPPPRREAPAEQRTQREESSEQRPPDRGPRRRRGRGGHQRDERQSQSSPPKPAPPATRSETHDAPKAPKPAPPATRSESHNAPKEPKPAPAPAPAPRREPPPPKPQKPAEKKDAADTVPFGHGIL